MNINKTLIITLAFVFSSITTFALSKNSNYRDIDEVFFKEYQSKSDITSLKEEIFEYKKHPSDFDSTMKKIQHLDTNQQTKELSKMAEKSSFIYKKSEDKYFVTYPICDKSTKNFKENVMFFLSGSKESYYPMASFLKNGLYKFKGTKALNSNLSLLVFEEVEVYKGEKSSAEIEIPKNYVEGEFYNHLVKYVCSPFGGLSKGNVYSFSSGSSNYNNASMILILQKASENTYLITLNSTLANLNGNERNPNVFYLESTDKYDYADGLRSGNYQCTGVFTYTTNQGTQMSIPAFKKIN